MSTATKTNHIGRKISRLRELRGWKQEALAAGLGVSQQAVSNIENSEVVEEDVLKKVAEVLGVSPEGIKNFSEEAVFNNIQNNYDNSQGHLTGPNYNCTFNPLDKMMAAFDENKKLYERLLASEREKIEILKGKNN